MRAILPAMMTSSSLLFRLAVGVALCWPAISARASAAEPLGTITRVENKAARVEELQGTPAVGALAQVFVVVPGLEEEAQVATAVVTKVADKHVEIRIDQATAPVEAGQLVRFRGAPAAAPRGRVPALVGLSAADAKTRLEASAHAASFRIGTAAPRPDLAFTVYEQAPPPNTQLAPGETVRVTIYAEAASQPHTLALASSLDGPLEADQAVVHRVLALLEQQHASGRKLDQEIALRWVQRFLLALDPDKLYFHQSDVAGFEKLVTAAPAKMADLRVPYTLFSVFLKRLDQRRAMIAQLLQSDLSPLEGDFYVSDPWQRSYAQNANDAGNLWRQRLRLDLLRLKSPGYAQADLPPAELLAARYERHRRLQYRLKDEELVGLYLNALAQAYDDHSRYHSPGEWESIDRARQGSLRGIGIELGEVDGAVQIAQLIAGGPAQLDGRLRLGDRLLALGSRPDALESLDNLRLAEVNERLLGKPGTVVHLQILPRGGGEPFAVGIPRGEIRLPPVGASVLESKRGARNPKVGYLRWASLVGEPGQPERPAASVKSELSRALEELRGKKVAVVLLDLRHASGGTVDQVTAAAGRFLPQGAILRSQRRGEQASTHAPLDAEPREDFRRFLDDAAPDRGGSAWKLPLVLLTDRETGGAAELFAAALQDYGRALIVGPGTTAEQGVDTATLPVISASSTGAQKNMGGLTVARGLFYRPSGNSLLDRGVAADVLLPSLRDQLGQADPFSSLLAAGQADRLEYQRLDYGVNQAVRDRLAARSAKRRSESAEHESLNQQLSSLLAADLGRIPLDDAAFQRWQAAQDALPAAGALANEAHDLQLREAVEISVDYVSSFEQSRGQRCYAERRWAQAARHFIESTQNDPLNAEAFNHFAWLLAACPAAEHRSGARAVEYASRACELSQNRQWAYLLTLALAHAEKKDFAAAIERLDQALALAPEGDRVKYLPLKAQFEKRRPYVAP